MKKRLEELKKGKILKRKKEGIYYTPEYVTDYICRNTIIPYLSKTNVNTVDKLIEEYKGDVRSLEQKFKEVKILDPACGIGAFLLKAVDVLLEIHHEIMLYKQNKGDYFIKRGKGSRKFKGVLKLTKWNEENEAREIIQNNIFGVDLNEESVEITQLSLFLKIAKKNKKLLDLSKNIKCGNSLIDDPELAGDKAFDWNKEFGEIFEKGGFDIIIGNPPYVRMEEFKEIKSFLKNNYTVHDERTDLYVYFYERAYNLLKEGGLLGFISSNTFLKTGYGLKLRKYLQEKTEIIKILDLGETQFFEGATTYPTIFFYRKVTEAKKSHKIQYLKGRSIKISDFIKFVKKDWIETEQRSLNPEMWYFEDKNIKSVISKLRKDTSTLKDYLGPPLYGIKTGFNDAFVIGEKERDLLIKKDPKSSELIRPFFMGKDLERWYTPPTKRYVIYVHHGVDIQKYPAIREHLLSFKNKLLKRATKQRWWELQQPQYKYTPFMDKDKIIYVDIASKPTFSLESNKNYLANSIYFLPTDDRYLLCLLNSKLMEWFIFFTSRAYSGGFVTFRNIYVERIPIKESDKSQKKIFSKKADLVIALTKEFHTNRLRFIKRLTNLGIRKPSKKLEFFWTLSFEEFQKEAYKLTKEELSLREQEEWEEYFEHHKENVIELKKRISRIETEIDQLVYSVYNISKSEREIIESSLKS